jgi:DNA-binding IclR family transcriptional regulator
MATNGGILARYSMVLDTVAAANDGLSLTEISRMTGLTPATAYRLVNALQGVGYIAQRDGRKIYVLGPRLLRLLHAGVSSRLVSSLAQPLLEELVDRFKETAFVSKLVGNGVESVAMVMPSGEAQAYVQPGRTMPMHAAASAKAIFAYQKNDVIDEVLAAPLTKYLDNTITDPDKIRADLKEVQRQGFAVCDEELDPGVLSFACPVQADGAGILYSIGIVGLSQRLKTYPLDLVVDALRDAAGELATRLQTGISHPAVVGHGSNRLRG